MSEKTYTKTELTKIVGGILDKLNSIHYQTLISRLGDEDFSIDEFIERFESKETEKLIDLILKNKTGKP